MKTDSKIATLRAKPVTVIALVVLVASLFGALALLYLINQSRTNDQRYLQQASDLRAQAYRLTSLARDATSGDEKAFDELSTVVNTMGSTWDMLRSSDESTRENLAGEFDKYSAIWARAKNNAQDIVTNKELIVSLNNVGKTLNENLPTLQTEHNNIVDILMESNAPTTRQSRHSYSPGVLNVLVVT